MMSDTFPVLHNHEKKYIYVRRYGIRFQRRAAVGGDGYTFWAKIFKEDFTPGMSVIKSENAVAVSVLGPSDQNFIEVSGVKEFI